MSETNKRRSPERRFPQCLLDRLSRLVVDHERITHDQAGKRIFRPDALEILPPPLALAGAGKAPAPVDLDADDEIGLGPGMEPQPGRALSTPGQDGHHGPVT